VATPREVVPQIGRQDAYRPAPGRPPPPPPTAISVEPMVEPTKKPVVVSVGSETTPLRLEEDEEYEEAEVTKVEAPAIEPSKHAEKPVEEELEEKESREPLKLEEEQPEEEVVEEPEEEKQVQQEPKGRAGSHSQ
jgi:hypothetical protein